MVESIYEFCDLAEIELNMNSSGMVLESGGDVVYLEGALSIDRLSNLLDWEGEPSVLIVNCKCCADELASLVSENESQLRNLRSLFIRIGGDTKNKLDISAFLSHLPGLVDLGIETDLGAVTVSDSQSFQSIETLTIRSFTDLDRSVISITQDVFPSLWGFSLMCRFETSEFKFLHELLEHPPQKLTQFHIRSYLCAGNVTRIIADSSIREQLTSLRINEDFPF